MSTRALNFFPCQKKSFPSEGVPVKVSSDNSSEGIRCMEPIFKYSYRNYNSELQTLDCTRTHLSCKKGHGLHRADN